MKIRLSDEDRKKFGCEEWLEFADTFSTQEAEAVEAAGVDPYLFGELSRPKASPKAVRLMVWLALRRAGNEVPFDECHFDFRSIQTGGEPGKAPSARSGARTRPASAATSTPRSSRKK